MLDKVAGSSMRAASQTDAADQAGMMKSDSLASVGLPSKTDIATDTIASGPGVSLGQSEVFKRRINIGWLDRIGEKLPALSHALAAAGFRHLRRKRALHRLRNHRKLLRRICKRLIRRLRTYSVRIIRNGIVWYQQVLASTVANAMAALFSVLCAPYRWDAVRQTLRSVLDGIRASTTRFPETDRLNVAEDQAASDQSLPLDFM